MNQEERMALFVGHTGSGKTSICAGLTGDRAKFKPDDSLVSAKSDPISHTLLLEAKNAEWISEGTQYKITIVDAPGFNDTNGLSDLQIMEKCLFQIQANNHKLTSVFLCLSHKKIGDAELRGVRALLERFKDTEIAEITTILLTHTETLTSENIAQQKQNLGRLVRLAELCGGRVEFVGFPFQEEYDAELHKHLKQFHEQSVDRFRTLLLRTICETPTKCVYWIDFERVVSAEKARIRKLTATALLGGGTLAGITTFLLRGKLTAQPAPI